MLSLWSGLVIAQTGSWLWGSLAPLVVVPSAYEVPCHCHCEHSPAPACAPAPPPPETHRPRAASNDHGGFDWRSALWILAAEACLGLVTFLGVLGRRCLGLLRRREAPAAELPIARLSSLPPVPSGRKRPLRAGSSASSPNTGPLSHLAVDVRHL